MMTREQLVQWLKENDWTKLDKSELDGICQRLGVSGRGSREENIAKIRKAIAKRS